MLQGNILDLIEAANESRVVINVLQEERDDEMVWDELFERAKEMAAEWNIDPRTPRLTVNQQHRVNVPANTPKQYWRRALYSVYLPLVDHLIQELNERLMKQHDRFLGQYLIPTKLDLLNPDTIHKIFCTYANDLTERVIFDGEIVRWKSKWQQLASEKPWTLQDTLCLTNKELYPNVSAILTIIILTIPVSKATQVRSFSCMRRIKTYLRNTMRAERLSGLALLHAYGDTSIDTNKVVQKFCTRKPRRLAFEFWTHIYTNLQSGLHFRMPL